MNALVPKTSKHVTGILICVPTCVEPCRSFEIYHRRDVMRFLGYRLRRNHQGQIVSHEVDRPEGVRAKGNSIKVYDNTTITYVVFQAKWHSG